MSQLEEWTGKKMYGRKGSPAEKIYGIVGKGRRRCPLAGCNGLRVRVVWPDGKVTWPCSKGLLTYRRNLRIG